MEDGADANRRLRKVGGRFPIRGMESVIATVSGYHGTERFNLIKMIDKIGASYVGSMNQSTTHLVCWKFEGKKYELAKKFKMSIINHRWIEDCIKEGRRLPETQYAFQCGQEVGPLMLDATIFRETKQTNYSKEPAIRIDSEEDYISWTDSTLLKENIHPGQSKCRDRPRKKSNSNVLNKDHPSSSIYCPDEHSLQCSRRTEIEELNFPSSAFFIPKKRNSQFPETSHRNRRLVKKTISEDPVEIISDSEEQIPQIQPLQDNVEETEVNRALDNVDWSLHVEGATSNPAGNKQEPWPAIDEVQNVIYNKVSRSTELSCVICWTDFSSSRGVLPCGHRFCFSCIQTWANQMASKRKVSTCPLCKASFAAITKVDDAIPADQKIYSQTIPDNSLETSIYILPEGETSRFPSNPSRTPVCCQCSHQGLEDLLIKCHLCGNLHVHSYCLDPPLLPWTCMHCKDLQRLYRRSW